MNRTPTTVFAHLVVLSILRCKNQMDRVAYCCGTLKRKDSGRHQVGLDYALEQGWLQYGTTNASARAWSRGASDGLLYITKAGKAWLRSHGSDYGSGDLFVETLRIERDRLAAEKAQGVAA